MAHTAEVKVEALRRLVKGTPVKELCRESNIPRSTLYRWSRDLENSNMTSEVPSPKNYEALQHQVKKLENIISVLKSAKCTVHAPLKEKLLELELLYDQYDVRTLCEALEVSRGTFYNHILRNKRGNTWFEKRRAEYRILIRDVFDEYRQVLGAEKIRTVLVQRGHQVSTEYVARLMKEMGLSSIRTTAKQDFLNLRESGKKRNVLRQQFSAARPNEVWVSDVTCFRLKDRNYYICIILDLFSRKVIAHKVSKKNSTQLITSTFKSAWEERNPEMELLFHSDRGAQYTSHRFQELLRSHAVVQSFSNSGKPHDNAVAESFFASLKKEELYRKDYASEPDFRRSISAYMEFYNMKRPHRTLKNRTPCQMEEDYQGVMGRSHGK
jgi:putative transposase